MIHRCNDRCKHGDHYHPSRQTYDSTERNAWRTTSYKKTTVTKPDPKMPDPSNYEVTDVHEYGKYQVLLVKYPGVTTFKGMKCLVVRASMTDLVKAKTLDPHFYDQKRPDGVEVVGRFPPTSEGVGNAKRFARALNGGTFKDPYIERGGPGDR